MPLIETDNEAVRNLKGLHLWHNALSNCSQRVRCVMSEKGLDWESHHVNLGRSEQTTDEYLSINPNGVVPTLVHDGKVIVESNDIIRYLDERFPEPPLHSEDPAEVERMVALIDAASAAQYSIKTLSFEFLLKPLVRMKDGALEDYAEKQARNPELVGFHREFSSRDGFPREKILEAARTIRARLAELDDVLSGQPWLSGSRIGLADVSWMVNAHRLKLMDFPMEEYPRVVAWYERVSRRPSFREGLKRYEPRPLRAIFGVYKLTRRLRGTAAGDFVRQIRAE